MPYRRLPNTDISRLRALESAIAKGESTPPFNLAFSQATLHKIKFFYPILKESIEINKIAYSRYSLKSEVYADMQKKARMYISHFIQVANFAIHRGDLPTDTGNYYQFNKNNRKTPNLVSEKEILFWGDNIIKGEAERLSKGLSPVTNPTIAVVKVHYEKFQKANSTQTVLYDASITAQEKLKIKRIEADNIIADLWNEIELSLENLPQHEKREKASEYGIVYVFRKNEKQFYTNAS